MEKRLRPVVIGLVSAVLVLAVVFVSGCQTPTSKPTPKPAAPAAPAPKPTVAASPAPKPAAPAPKPAAPARPTVEIELLATSAGTTSYIVSGAVTDLLTKNLPWLKLAVTATLGSDQNIIDGTKKDPKKVIIASAEGSYKLATAGLPPFDRKYTNVKYIAAYGASYIFWGTLDPKISTPQDLIGKRIAISPRAQFNGKVGEWLLQEYGIIDKVKVSIMDFNASAEAMKDGLVDVILLSLTGSSGTKSPPTPHVKDLLETRGDKLRFLSFDFETLKKVEKTQGMPLGMDTIPAGTLGPGQTKPIEAFVMGTAAHAAFDGADPDVIYEIAKTIATKYRDLQAYHPSLRGVTPQQLINLMPIKSENEISPGALKYYKEAGLWPPKK